MTVSKLSLCSLLFIGLIVLVIERSYASNPLDGSTILEKASVQGGLVVHVGCADGRLTASLRASDSFVIHGLDTDANNVRAARRHVESLGLYGPISIDQFDGRHLPYVDNSVKMIVISNPYAVDEGEIQRVLAPEGVAVTIHPDTSALSIKRKPRPAQIDEWTHYLHDPTNNAVAHDSVVGPLKHLQWVGNPRWSRHHDRMASMSAMVSSGGRIFYIIDEGPKESILLPPDWKLVARDAFSGVLLWKRTIPDWFTTLIPYKCGSAQLPRRLVAVGERVYVTLGLMAPVAALDAATGKTLRTYPSTEGTQEILVSGSTVFALVSDTPQEGHEYCFDFRCVHQERERVAEELPWNEQPRRLFAFDAETAQPLWSHTAPVAPQTLAVDQRAVYFHDGQAIVCLDRENGTRLWTSKPVDRMASIPAFFAQNLVVFEDVVLFSGGSGTLIGLDARTGERLWTAPQLPSGYKSPQDVLVANGLVWGSAVTAGRDSGQVVGRDPRTGEVKVDFLPDVSTYWFHHRCYRGKATDKYLLLSRTGIELVDIREQHWTPHYWIRGGCIYGIMPANGLIYTPPHSCACYMDAKMYGLCAVASSRRKNADKDARDEDRLQRGPVYETIRFSDSDRRKAASAQWPTFRADAARSGHTDVPLPETLKESWQADLGEPVTSPVVAERRVFVTTPASHAVHALDAQSGRKAWTFTASGRVDSPPTVFEGRVLFGCADGYVYCLDAANGELAWRFRAAPEDLRLVAWEQLESVWPVHGSVLVLDGVVYAVAGRSMYLDGGLHLVRLDARTGELLSEKILDDQSAEADGNLQQFVKGLNMPTALPDVLSSDGCFLYMRTQRMDLNGNRINVAPEEVTDQSGEGRHLFANVGLLDDTWFHRGYWVYGKSIASGANGWFHAGRLLPAGHLLVVSDDAIYGFARRPEYYRWTSAVEYHLFATDKDPEVVKVPGDRSGFQRQLEKCEAPTVHPVFRWSTSLPIYVRAMIQAGPTLWMAGPPDVVDEEEAYRRIRDPEMQAKLKEQQESLAGKRGGKLFAVKATDGSVLWQCDLDEPPRFDGMAAANGRLYMSTSAGKVVCFSGK